MKPLFIWAGGKTKVLKHYARFMPTAFETYYEPFFGGGAMFVYVMNTYRPKNVVINDINSDVINIYKAIKTDLDEFQQRREIVGPFLDRYAFERAISMPIRFRLAILARLAGKEDMAGRVLKGLRINTLPRRLKRVACCYCGTFHGIGTYDEVFDLLIACNPSIALRTLRLTRPAEVKSDADEEHPKRKETLARCYQALRPSSKIRSAYSM